MAVAAVEQMSRSEKSPQPYNIKTGSGFSNIEDIIKIVAKALALDVVYFTSPIHQSVYYSVLGGRIKQKIHIAMGKSDTTCLALIKDRTLPKEYPKKELTETQKRIREMLPVKTKDTTERASLPIAEEVVAKLLDLDKQTAILSKECADLTKAKEDTDRASQECTKELSKANDDVSTQETNVREHEEELKGLVVEAINAT